MSGSIRYRHNNMTIQSLESFFNIKGRYYNGNKDVYFVRSLGELPNMKKTIVDCDKKMLSAMQAGKFKYYRLSKLPSIVLKEDIEFYSKGYLKWKNNKYVELRTINTNNVFHQTLSAATKLAIEKYQSVKSAATETMIQNFVIKLWHWLDKEFKEFVQQWSADMTVKIVAMNVTKVQEYLFYYMMTCLGCDVLILNTKEDLKTKEEIAGLSTVFTLGAYGKTEIPDFVYKTDAPKAKNEERKTRTVPENRGISAARNVAENRGTSVVRSEKTFENLAMLASSIVMIAVHDKDDTPIATGSGIMIGKKGFILTNHHVIESGKIFAVRIEDDETVYLTDEVIKYNSHLDLAIIRIDKELTPLPIYNGSSPLVRGQKVVAIGSPLGLFNSVSDGIISGFRNIGEVDMIQFTAPISHGSSGGAVLNMYGEIIGISTAGIDSGQNINLAVGYENIRIFAKGFI